MKKLFFCLFLLISLLTFPGTKYYSLQAPNPTCGNQVTVNVNVDNADDLIALQWLLYFDNTVFSYASYTEDPILSGWTITPNATSTYIAIAAASAIPIPSGTGAKTLISFTFNTLVTVCDGTIPQFQLRNVKWSTTTDNDVNGNNFDLNVTVSCPANPPISVPSNPDPANGATNVPLIKTLAWVCTGADRYDLYLGTTNPPPFYGTTTTNSYTVSLTSNTQYYWYVDAYNTDNNCPHGISPVWSFTTVCDMPGAFNNLSPANGATNQPINGLVLDWEDSAGATSYDLYFGTSSPPPLFQSNLSTSTYTLNGLSNSQTYYWYVVAKNTCGSTQGAEWSFTTAAPSGANLSYSSSTFTDSCSLGGPGDNNGVIDPGETINLNIVLANTGTAGATGVSATISTTTSGVTITTNSANYPNIPASGTGQSTTPYVFNVDHLVPCGTTINFAINITSNEGSWSGNFQLTVGSTTITLLTQNFATVTPPALPSNWSSVIVNKADTTDPAWATNATTHHPSGQPPHSSPNLVWFNSYHAPSGSTARLQYNVPFNFSPFSTITLSFWMYHDTGYSSRNDRVQIQYSTNGGVSWTDIGSPVSRYDGTTGWKEHTVDLSTLAGQTSVLIGFLGISAYGNDVHLDTIKITGSSANPVCFECWCYTPETFNLLTPTNGATNQPINNLLLDWENSNYATAYDLFFGTTNPPTLYQSNLLASQYTVSGLSLNTTYYWFVRAKNACGTYDSAVWSFTTASCVKIAYGFDLLNEKLVSFDLSNPGSFTVIGATTGDDPFGADFLGNDYTKIYALDYTLNQLVTYSTTNAAKTVIGPATPNSAAPYWTGMAGLSGTLYAISTNCAGTSYLYTINPTTGAATAIGQIPGLTCPINLGATPTGLLYTLDISNDNIYRIDWTNATATLVGPVGFNANYAQGMEFDIDGATMYLSAFNVDTWQGDLRSLNLTTGASTLIGAFPGGTEVDGLAITSCTGCTVLPSSFNLISPANNSTDQPITNLTLDWGDSSNAIFYNLWFGTTNPPPLYASGIKVSNYTIAGPLTENTTYYWYVEAIGACGSSQTSTFNFKTVSAAPPPAIYYDSYSLQEDICPTGGAHHSNTIDPGETVYLNVSIANETTAGPATGITGILSTTTPGVTIFNANTTFPDMLPGQTVASSTPFIFQLDPTYPCGTAISFNLQINANGGTYQANLSFNVQVGSTYALLLNEGFENTTFPPAGWSTYNLDGGGTQWLRTTVRYHSGTASAYHAYSTAGNQNGWLVTPPISIPSGATGVNFSFWEYTLYASYYVYHGLWVCTSGCGTPPTNWTQVATFGSPTSSWRQQTVNLNAYQGQTIQLAFVYQGYDADNWYIDDVLLEINSATPFCTVCPAGTPALSYASHSVVADDCLTGGPGDGNGIAEPGEYVDLNVLISNIGTGNATNVQATLTTTNPNVTIITGTANYGFILAGGTKGPQAPFRVYLAESIPCFSTIDFTLNITSSEGSWIGNFQLNVGGAGALVNLVYEQFETWPPAGWTIVDEQPGWSCDVWQSTAYWGVPNETGGSGEAADADADACGDGMDTSMITPPINLTGYAMATLEYDCYFDNYLDYDHAWTDISTDGGSTWTNLRHETTDDPDTGHHVIIDLTPYVGNTIQIRFHYYAPGWDWYWQVDNVKISASTSACYVCLCPPPGAFNLLAPPNGATGVSIPVLLDWQDSTGATSYNLYFGTSSTPPLYQSGITSSQFNMTSLANSTTYYWRVEAVNVCGVTSSPTWSFTTASGCLPPDQPQLISPPNGATDLPLSVDLVWNGYNTDYYQVYFGPVKNNMQLLGTTTSTSYRVSGLQPGTTYYWAINAINACGNALSTFFSFTTAGAPPEEKFEMIIPAVASAQGARSSYWKTDIQIFNPNEEALDYTISFIPPDTNGTTTPYKVTGTINPYELKIFNDIVKNTFGLDQIAGGIQITTKKYLVATGRTYTLAEEGTYGQFVKGYTVNDTIGKDSTNYFVRQDEVAHLVHLINSFSFRTNVGFMEVSGKGVTVNITLFDSQNHQLGTGNFSLLPKGFLQVNNIFETLNISGFYNPARAEIKVSGDGAVFSYASVVDNQSNDAIFVPAIKEGALAPTQHFAVAAHTPGAEGTFWRTDLRLFNPSDDSQEVTFTFWEKNQSFTKTVQVEGKATVKYNDVINELFQLQQNHGLLILSGNPGFISTSRIYNTSGEAKTYGQFVPSSIIHKPITINQTQYILHMSSNASFRTNLGMTEVSGRPATVEVTLYNRNGTEIGKGTFNLTAYEQKQINRIFEVFNLGQIDNGYAKVTVLSGQGSVMVYASVVDNLTGDAIYVIGQ